MKPDRPSKNLITTLPRTASHTTTSAICEVRSLPSTLPMKLRSVASISSVARAIRASPLPFSSPIDSSATRGRSTPRTRSEKIAPMRAYWARFSAVESGLAPMSSSTNGLSPPTIWTASAGPVDAAQAPEAQDRGRHARAGVPGGHDRVGLPAPDEVRGDEDRGVLLLAQGERGLLVHVHDLGGVDGADVRGAVAQVRRENLVGADEDDGVLGMGSRVGEGARDDLGGAVVTAHRVDRDPDAAGDRRCA